VSAQVPVEQLKAAVLSPSAGVAPEQIAAVQELAAVVQELTAVVQELTSVVQGLAERQAASESGQEPQEQTAARPEEEDEWRAQKLLEQRPLAGSCSWEAERSSAQQALEPALAET